MLLLSNHAQVVLAASVALVVRRGLKDTAAVVALGKRRRVDLEAVAARRAVVTPVRLAVAGDVTRLANEAPFVDPPVCVAVLLAHRPSFDRPRRMRADTG